MLQELIRLPQGTIAILGNGDIKPGLLQQIESADYIVRFNNPCATRAQYFTKTDALVLSNSSKQTTGLLSNQSYIKGAFFGGAEIIILPYHPSIIARYMPKPNPLSYLRGARADQTQACVKACNSARKDYCILGAETYLEVCDELKYDKKKMHSCFPSSGIMIIHYLMAAKESETQIDLYGFGFTGWKRHDWATEKAYISSCVANNRLRIWQ